MAVRFEIKRRTAGGCQVFFNSYKNKKPVVLLRQFAIARVTTGFLKTRGQWPNGAKLNTTIRELARARRSYRKQKTRCFHNGFLKERRRHTLPHNCSTICAGGLNFSVRYGKR